MNRGKKKKENNLQLASGSFATPRYLVFVIRGHVYMATCPLVLYLHDAMLGELAPRVDGKFLQDILTQGELA